MRARRPKARLPALDARRDQAQLGDIVAPSRKGPGTDRRPRNAAAISAVRCKDAGSARAAERQPAARLPASTAPDDDEHAVRRRAATRRRPDEVLARRPPDRFERKKMLPAPGGAVARVNEAYPPELDRWTAAYLCELAACRSRPNGNTAMPAAFPMQQMEWREALDDAAGGGCWRRWTTTWPAAAEGRAAELRGARRTRRRDLPPPRCAR